MKRAVFPGSFDPPTFGHLDIIERGSRIFDELIVVVAENPAKNNLFSAEERCAMIRRLTEKIKNASVDICPASLLLVDFLRQKNIDFIVRGLRDYDDWKEESELASVNKILSAGKKTAEAVPVYPGVETVFLSTRPELSVISSSAVRTIACFNGDLSFFIPAEVATAIHKKMKGNHE
ncbi:MAG: pantetheine-phosphate adenylyltransferase [Spirochaetaceae bacterium]|jgi:pantetheine-phosphate adenylyltransferase|nr:pantetheine-phosphate adenylyltransferase [Spirochaetaceae bacterium]